MRNAARYTFHTSIFLEWMTLQLLTFFFLFIFILIFYIFVVFPHPSNKLIMNILKPLFSRKKNKISKSRNFCTTAEVRSSFRVKV